jgi:hypothetical protein
MNLKKITTIGIIFIFLFSFITHNLYEWFPSFLTSLFFPVNESIWEHQKMIFTTVLLWGLIEYFLLKKYEHDYDNIVIATVVSAVTNIIIFLIVYIPIHVIWGHNLLVTLIVYLITIIISQVIGYRILSIEDFNNKLHIIAIITIAVMFIIFGILTYYPLNWELLFYDNHSDKHGIYSYYST